MTQNICKMLVLNVHNMIELNREERKSEVTVQIRTVNPEKCAHAKLPINQTSLSASQREINC